MARGRPRLKCDNCFYGKPGKCEYPYPGAPCLRCQELRIVCGGIPARDAPTPPGKVRPLPRPAARAKKDPSATPARLGRPPKSGRPSLASASSTPAGSDGRPVNMKPRINLKLRLPVPAAPLKPQTASRDASSGLSGPDDELDSDEDELFSSESDDPDDRAFRPSYVPRARGGDVRPSRASRGSSFVTPAPDVDRTTRSALANVSTAPRVFFKRGPLPPQPGPLTNKRPRTGNPVEFFQARGAERDILSEDGSANEINDLEKMGLYIRPAIPEPSLRKIAATMEDRLVDKGKRRSMGTGNRLSSLLYDIGDDPAQPSSSSQSDGRRSTWVSLRVSSPTSRPASPPIPHLTKVPPPGHEGVLHYMGMALAAQKEALLRLVMPQIVYIFNIHTLTIWRDDLEHELVTMSLFNEACAKRASQMIIRGFEIHDDTFLAACVAATPTPPATTVKWLEDSSTELIESHSQPTLICHPPQTIRDMRERTSDPYIAQGCRNLLNSIADGICDVCDGVAGLHIDKQALMQAIIEREGGAIAAVIRADVYRRDKRDEGVYNSGQYQSPGAPPFF